VKVIESAGSSWAGVFERRLRITSTGSNNRPHSLRETSQLSLLSLFQREGYFATGSSRSATSRSRGLHPLFDRRLQRHVTPQWVLTVVSRGCATGTTAGPVCDTITRAALLSDKGGNVVVEAISQRLLAQSWHNAYGATAECSGLVSEFSLADVQKVRNSKGEFLIVTFNGVQLLKTYAVKEKHIKKLGL
jgi:hypothetical protein